MPKEIQDAIGTVALQTEFGIVGGFRLKLDETVVPVVVMRDLSKDTTSEWRHAFRGHAEGAGGAGNRSHFALLNPAGSGILIELYEWQAGAGAGCNWEATVNNTPYVPGTILNGVWQDLKDTYGTIWSPVSSPVGELRHAVAAAAITGTIVFTAQSQSSNSIKWNPKALLNPGEQINFSQESVNQDAYVGVQWRERPLKPNER